MKYIEIRHATFSAAWEAAQKASILDMADKIASLYGMKLYSPRRTDGREQ